MIYFKPVKFYKMKNLKKTILFIAIVAAFQFFSVEKSFGQCDIHVTNNTSVHYYFFIVDGCGNRIPNAPPGVPIDVGPHSTTNMPDHNGCGNCYASMNFADAMASCTFPTSGPVAPVCTTSTWTIYSDCISSNPATLSYDCTTNTWYIN
jgi:hypothetical protein